jgi:hypothetical protein
MLGRMPESWLFLTKVRAMNEEAFTAPGQGFPAGPYHGSYGKEIGARYRGSSKGIRGNPAGYW